MSDDLEQLWAAAIKTAALWGHRHKLKLGTLIHATLELKLSKWNAKSPGNQGSGMEFGHLIFNVDALHSSCHPTRIKITCGTSSLLTVDSRSITNWWLWVCLWFWNWHVELWIWDRNLNSNWTGFRICWRGLWNQAWSWNQWPLISQRIRFHQRREHASGIKSRQSVECHALWCTSIFAFLLRHYLAILSPASSRFLAPHLLLASSLLPTPPFLLIFPIYPFVGQSFKLRTLVLQLLCCRFPSVMTSPIHHAVSCCDASFIKCPCSCSCFCSFMPPDLIPNLNNRAMPFLLSLSSWTYLVPRSWRLRNQALLCPIYSPWLPFSNATVLCAKKSFWGCVLIPYYPCHGNIFINLLVSMTVILGTTH